MESRSASRNTLYWIIRTPSDVTYHSIAGAISRHILNRSTLGGHWHSLLSALEVSRLVIKDFNAVHQAADKLDEVKMFGVLVQIVGAVAFIVEFYDEPVRVRFLGC